MIGKYTFANENIKHMGCAMQKRVFSHMRTAKTQISLHIRAVLSGPLLSAKRIFGYYRMFQWKANARIILCACAGWCASAHFAHDRRHFFACTVHTQHIHLKDKWYYRRPNWDTMKNNTIRVNISSVDSYFWYEDTEFSLRNSVICRALNGATRMMFRVILHI